MNEKEMIDKIEFLINKIFIIWCEMKNNDKIIVNTEGIRDVSLSID